MTGMDGINSLQKTSGALQVNEATRVNGTAAAAAKAADQAATVPSSMGVDHASLSASGTIFAQQAATSDVRLTRVAEISRAISSGTYKVSASDLADKIIDSLLK